MSMRKIDYAFIMCFKRNFNVRGSSDKEQSDTKLCKALIEALAGWASVPVEHISINDVALVLNGTIATMGLLATEHKISAWYDALRTSAIHIEQSVPLVFKELGLSDQRSLLAIRHVLSFSHVIRWSNIQDVPGLQEYIENEYGKL